MSARHPARREEKRVRLFALVDCSAFYCSCERLFRADLRDHPVVVLSNNDGCVIARTQEAKDLGIPMGAPYFQVKRELEEKGVAVFSSNYSFYADMSSRVQQVLERFSPDVERYSIDEAFLELTADGSRPEEERERLDELAREIRRAVIAATRIPVRVSIAETKTLAKAASEYARALLKQGEEPCISFWGHPCRDRFLSTLPVSDVWGVGRQWARKLERSGVRDALALSRMNQQETRERYNVVMLRTVLELGGLSCIPLEKVPPTRKGLVRSRMFGEALTEIEPISRAVATHTATAAQKLRAEGLAAGFLEVFVSTGKHGHPLRRGSAGRVLLSPTNDTLTLTREAKSLLRECFLAENRQGEHYRYKKAGVMMTELLPEGERQSDLFGLSAVENPQLMAALDRINSRFGKHSVVTAAQGTPDSLRTIDAARAEKSGWGMRREHMSPRYTTQWSELPKIRV